MAENEEQNKQKEDFSYMEALSKAYEEAFAKRLKRSLRLSEEKRDLVVEMQREIDGLLGLLSRTMHSDVRKELASMIRESASEILHLISEDGTDAATANAPSNLPLTALLPRATLLANRSLNLLIRHGENTDRIVLLILSELSALYALAAIS